MALTNSIWRLLNTIFNIGVPDDMSPEDAKYIRMINMGALIFISFVPAYLIPISILMILYVEDVNLVAILGHIVIEASVALCGA